VPAQTEFHGLNFGATSAYEEIGEVIHVFSISQHKLEIMILELLINHILVRGRWAPSGIAYLCCLRQASQQASKFSAVRQQ